MKDKSRFIKLMSTMEKKPKVSNPGIDDELRKKMALSEQLERIDQKIAELEEDGDEESLKFWKNRRTQLVGE